MGGIHMYIVVDKNTGEYIKDIDADIGAGEEILSDIVDINREKQQVIYVEDKSPFVKVLSSMFENGDRFKVELVNDKVVGIRLL